MSALAALPQVPPCHARARNLQICESSPPFSHPARNPNLVTASAGCYRALPRALPQAWALELLRQSNPRSTFTRAGSCRIPSISSTRPDHGTPRFCFSQGPPGLLPLVSQGTAISAMGLMRDRGHRPGDRCSVGGLDLSRLNGRQETYMNVPSSRECSISCTKVSLWYSIPCALVVLWLRFSILSVPCKRPLRGPLFRAHHRPTLAPYPQP